MRRLKVKCSSLNPLLIVNRSKQWKQRMVYILATNKIMKYGSGLLSHIIYIGTTRNGAGRPAASAVSKAKSAFKLRGVKTVGIYIATCRGRRAMKSWIHLESGLLQAFFDRYHQLPKYNKKRPHFAKDKFFRQSRLEKLIQQFEKLKLR